MTFSLILASEKKEKNVIFFFVFGFTNKQIQKKKEKRKPTSVFRFICSPN